jgi:hypothetical protein
MAAHFALVCSGALPSRPAKIAAASTESAFAPASVDDIRYTLLGCDVSLPSHRAVADCVAISALRMTEVLEWALSRSFNSGNRSGGSGGAVASLGKSLIGMFGLGPAAPNESDKTKAGTGAGTGPAEGEGLTPSQFLHVRSVLCPLKLRFAYVLADLGLVKEAAAYASEAKQIVHLCGAQGRRTYLN